MGTFQNASPKKSLTSVCQLNSSQLCENERIFSSFSRASYSVFLAFMLSPPPPECRLVSRKVRLPKWDLVHAPSHFCTNPQPVSLQRTRQGRGMGDQAPKTISSPQESKVHSRENKEPSWIDPPPLYFIPDFPPVHCNLYRVAQNLSKQVLRISYTKFHLISFQFVVIPHGKRDLSSLPEAAVHILWNKRAMAL